MPKNRLAGLFLYEEVDGKMVRRWVAFAVIWLVFLLVHLIFHVMSLGFVVTLGLWFLALLAMNRGEGAPRPQWSDNPLPSSSPPLGSSSSSSSGLGGGGTGGAGCGGDADGAGAGH
jgi:hypothetical protein